MSRRRGIPALVLVLALLSFGIADAQAPLGDDIVLSAPLANLRAEFAPQAVCDDAGVCALFWLDNYYTHVNRVDVLGVVISPQGRVLTQPRILITGHLSGWPLAVGMENGFAVIWGSFAPDGYESSHMQYLNESLAPTRAPITLPFSESLRINDPNLYEGFYTIVRTPTGFILYGSTVDSHTTPSYDAFAYFINRDGKVIHPRMKVNEGSGQNANTQSFGGLAIQPNGNFVAVYWLGNDPIPMPSSIYMRRFSADGKPLGSQKIVDPENHSFQRGPVVASGPDGSFLIVWQSSPTLDSPSDILARRFSARGQALGKPFQVNNVHQLDQRYPAVTSDAQGNYFIAWQSLTPPYSWEIKGRLFRHDGTPVADEVRLNKVRQFEQELPRVVFSSDGTVIAGWRSDSSRQRGIEEFVPVARVFSVVPKP